MERMQLARVEGEGEVGGSEGAWGTALLLATGQPLVTPSFQGRNSLIPFLGELETTRVPFLMQRAGER